jgi:hypothetical protein
MGRKPAVRRCHGQRDIRERLILPAKTGRVQNKFATQIRDTTARLTTQYVKNDANPP